MSDAGTNSKVPEAAKNALAQARNLWDYYIQKKYILSMFAFNCILLWVFGVIALVHLRNIDMFTYPMTKRSVVNDFNGISGLIGGWGVDKDGISENLQYPLNATGRVLLQDAVFTKAKCFGVSYAGDQQWKAGEVSPMCNCLENMLTEFVMAHVGNNASMIPQLELIDRALLLKTNKTATRAVIEGTIRKKCFTGVRATQVEDLYDTSSFFSLNIVNGVIVWNTLSAGVSFFVTWQTMSEQMDKRKLNTKDQGVIAVSTNILRDVGMFVGAVVLLHWPLVVILLQGRLWETALSVGIPVLFFVGFVGGMQMMGHYRDTRKKANGAEPPQSWQFRKSLVFWVSYTIILPYIVGSFNALTQRRDDIYNLTTTILAICVALVGMTVDFARSAVNDQLLENVKVNRDYKSFYNYSWFCNITILGILFSMPGADFNPGPFSNTYTVVSLSLGILFVIPVMQKMSLSSSNGSVIEDDDLFILRGGLDMVARTLYTIAVISDLTGTMYADNIYLDTSK